MKKLHLHIGVHKTGTTYIQSYLAANRDTLAERGFLYPESPGKTTHHAVPLAFSSKENPELAKRLLHGADATVRATFKQGFFEDFRAEVEGFAGDDVILSSELCSSRLGTHQDLVALKQWLDQFFSEVSIVVYIRRQDDLYLSHYSTCIKNGMTIMPELRPLPWFDYDRLLTLWGGVFGRDHLKPRIFESGEFRNGKLEDDFLDQVGIPSSEGFRPVERRNESMDAVRLEFLREFNRHVQSLAGDRYNPLRGDIVGVLMRNPGEHGLMTLPDSDLVAFFDSYAASNAKVARDYFGRDDGRLFRPRSSGGKRMLHRPITAEEAVQIAAELWTAMKRRNRHLEEQLRTLKASAKAE